MKLINFKNYMYFMLWGLSLISLCVLSVFAVGEAAGDVTSYFDRHTWLTLCITLIIFTLPFNIFFYSRVSRNESKFLAKVKKVFLWSIIIGSAGLMIAMIFGLVFNALNAKLLMTDIKEMLFAGAIFAGVSGIAFYGIKKHISFKLYSLAISLLAVVCIVFLFSQIDSPVKFHSIQKDYENYQALLSAAKYQRYPFSEVLVEYNDSQQLPETLNEENQLTDTNAPVYTKLGSNIFSLCLNFEHDSPIVWSDDGYEPGDLYKAGQECFVYTMQCDLSRTPLEIRAKLALDKVYEERGLERVNEDSCSKYKIDFLKNNSDL